MIAFEVKDMTCGHCVNAITRAVQATDRGAQVQIDLATHRVNIASDRADPAALAAAISEAGYTPSALPVVPAPAAMEPRPRGGCCCGPKSGCANA